MNTKLILNKTMIIALAVLNLSISENISAMGNAARTAYGASNAYKALTVHRGISTIPNGPWYKILGVSENATQAEINTVYRKLAQQYHPDKFIDPAEKAAAQEAFKKINSAKDQATEFLKNGHNSNYSSHSYKSAQEETYHSSPREETHYSSHQKTHEAENRREAKENLDKLYKDTEEHLNEIFKKYNINPNLNGDDLKNATLWEKMKLAWQGIKSGRDAFQDEVLYDKFWNFIKTNDAYRAKYGQGTTRWTKIIRIISGKDNPTPEEIQHILTGVSIIS